MKNGANNIITILTLGAISIGVAWVGTLVGILTKRTMPMAQERSAGRIALKAIEAQYSNIISWQSKEYAVDSEQNYHRYF